MLAELRDLEFAPVEFGQGDEEIPVLPLLRPQRRLGTHVDGLELGFGLVARGANIHAQRAAGAILRGDLQRETHPFELRHARGSALESRGRTLERRRFIDLRPDRRVRADGHTFQALDANLLVPNRNVQREVALLVLRRGGRERAVHRKRAHGQVVALAGGEFAQHVLHELRRIGRDRRQQPAAAVHVLRHRHFVQMLQRVVHRLEVHGHDFLAFFAVGLLDGILDGLDGLVPGQHPG